MLKYKSKISIPKLLSKVNPLKNPPWTATKPISSEEILSCIINGDFTDPIQTKRDNSLSHKDHVKRIAYLVVNKDEKPISLRIDGNGSIKCTDGNHRLAAAIYRGDEDIEAYLTILDDEYVEI